jgi:G:T/U-mismatch repair DNA glycosylase
MNALKHGNYSKKLEMLRENSLNFETRQHKWMSSEDPRNDSETFLVHRRVALSFELERAERAHLQRLRSAIENVEENDYSAVNAIGERLLHDPAGHRSLYGIRPRIELLKNVREWRSPR